MWSEENSPIGVLIWSFGKRWVRQENLKRPGKWYWILQIGTLDMLVNKDFEELFRLLNSVQAKYLVVGAYAVIFHTEPRYTKDIDVWVKSDPDNANKVYKALRNFGAPLMDLTIKDLEKSTTVYQIGVEPNRIDILTGIGGISFEKAWQRRRKDYYGHERISILDLKDVIKAKKNAGRKQDLLDLEVLKIAQRKKPKKTALKKNNKFAKA